MMKANKSLPRQCKRVFSMDMYCKPNRTGYNFAHITHLAPTFGEGFKVRENIPYMDPFLCAAFNEALNSDAMVEQMNNLMPIKGVCAVKEFSGRGSGVVVKGEVLSGNVVNFYTGTVTASTQAQEQFTERELAKYGAQLDNPQR